MRYVSTRGNAPVLDFEGVTLAGLAADGGLSLPEKWPTVSADRTRALRGLSYAETAAEVMAPVVGQSLPREEPKAPCEQSHGRSTHDAVPPLPPPHLRHRPPALSPGPTPTY